MTHVLVLDAQQRNALVFIRSLGLRQVFIKTAEHTITALAGNSRYSRTYLTHSNPQTEDQFITKIIQICSKYHSTLILPMTELTTTLILANPDKSPSETNTPFPDLAVVYKLANKSELLIFAIVTCYAFFDFGRSGKNARTYKFKKQLGTHLAPLYWQYWSDNNGELPQLNP